jgi:hypothetical protein
MKQTALLFNFEQARQAAIGSFELLRPEMGGTDGFSALSSGRFIRAILRLIETYALGYGRRIRQSPACGNGS